MSPVYKNSGPGIGAGLDAFTNGLIGAYMANRQYQTQRQDVEYRRNRDQEDQDLALALQGMHRGRAPMEAMNLGGGGLGPNGTITAPTVAPSRFTQLTPGVYRDENEVAQNRRNAAAAAFEKSFGEALAKSQGEAAGKPTEFTPLTTDGGVFNYDKRTGSLGSRLGDRPTPLTTPSFQPVTTAGGVFAFDTKGGALGPRLGDRPPLQAQPDNTLVPVQQPDGSIIYTPRAAAIGQQAPSPTNKGAASLQQKIAENQATLAAIADARRQVKEHPDAFGIVRGLPLVGDRLDQYSDPAGVNARAAVANIGSAKIHERNGSAVSAKEFQRTAPFVPDISNSADAILKKLDQMEVNVRQESDALQSVGGRRPVLSAPPAAAPGGRGGRGAMGDSGNIDLRDPESIWAEKNPPMKGETFDQYHARFLKAAGGKP